MWRSKGKIVESSTMLQSQESHHFHSRAEGWVLLQELLIFTFLFYPGGILKFTFIQWLQKYLKQPGNVSMAVSRMLLTKWRTRPLCCTSNGSYHTFHMSLVRPRDRFSWETECITVKTSLLFLLILNLSEPSSASLTIKNVVLNCSEQVLPNTSVCVKSNVSGFPSIYSASYLTCYLLFALIWLLHPIHNFTENGSLESATQAKTPIRKC